MTWIKVASKNEIHESSGKEVIIGNNRIALFCSRGEFFAIDALCRHQDGSLAPGKIDGEIVECPLHSWHYNIRTGELLDYLKGVKLKTYNVNVKDKDIFVEI